MKRENQSLRIVAIAAAWILENYKKTNGEQEQWTFQGWEFRISSFVFRQGEI